MNHFPTPGHWHYVEGEPGDMGSREEPPTPSYPPTIIAQTTVGDIEIAQLCEPIAPGARYDPEAGPEWLGDPDANGRLMAAAPRLREALRGLVEHNWADLDEQVRECVRAEHPDHPIVRAEQALKKAKEGSE